jgi:hypothetical protein
LSYPGPKTLLKDIYLYISSTCFNEKGKLRFFSNVYTTFELQKSQTFGISKSFTLFLSKIRLSAHSLAIEMGRYNKPFTPTEERYCKDCLNQVKNENYFLLYCPLYNCIRESFQSILKNSQNSTEDDLLLQIINPINPQDTKDICLFIIKESFTKRETFKEALATILTQKIICFGNW